MTLNGDVTSEPPNKTFDTILVLDFGSQYVLSLAYKSSFWVVKSLIPGVTIDIRI